MRARKIAAMIGIKHTRDTTDMPARIIFAPNRLAEGQRGTEDTGRVEPDTETGHRTAVVVDDHGQPGTSRLFLGVQNPYVEGGMVGLPDLVRAAGPPSIEEIVLFAVRFRPCLCQGDEGWVKGAEEAVLEALRRFLDSHRPDLQRMQVLKDVEWGLHGRD